MCVCLCVRKCNPDEFTSRYQDYKTGITVKPKQNWTPETFRLTYRLTNERLESHISHQFTSTSDDTIACWYCHSYYVCSI